MDHRRRQNTVPSVRFYSLERGSIILSRRATVRHSLTLSFPRRPLSLLCELEYRQMATRRWPMDPHTHVEESPTQQSEAANEVAYLSICSGCIITIDATEERKVVLGQLVVLAVAVFSSTVTLLMYGLYSAIAW